jgi:hydrogenase expression/formation protein HypD
MKYIDEYRDAPLARKLLDEIHRITTRPWALMEVCGGQTHTLVKQGIDEALPAGVRMIHGPGCPVCVTPLEQIDKALAIAARPDVIFTSYGDMLRVPGSTTDLLSLKASGSRPRTRTARSSFSPSASRRPLRRTRWPFGRRLAWA